MEQLYTITAAPPTGTNNIYVVYIGKSLGENTPGENSIEFGMIKSINGGYENKALYHQRLQWMLQIT